MTTTLHAGTVHMFPAQGSQRIGMGSELFDGCPDLVRQADRVLGYSIEALCRAGSREQLTCNEYAQPALFVVDALHALDWRERYDTHFAALAGHSLGELCALHLAGAYDFETGVAIVRERGRLMAAAPSGAMAAVTRVSPDAVAEVLADDPSLDIQIANLNSPSQCVLSGRRDHVLSDNTARVFERIGAKYVPLNVSGPLASHGGARREVPGVPRHRRLGAVARPRCLERHGNAVSAHRLQRAYVRPAHVTRALVGLGPAVG